MKMILKYLEELKKECVLAPLFKMLEALFELFVPLVVASIIDRGIGQQDTAYIVKMCLMLLGLAIIGLVCYNNSTIFQCQGGSWLCYRNKACFIQAYTVTFVHGDGRHWNVNSYDKNDK